MITADSNRLCRSGRRALATIALTLFGCVTAANAQSPVVMSTNVRGVNIVVPPPPGFDPITASKSERALYAVPPEPDPTLAPYAHAIWQRTLSGFTQRQTQVEVQQTTLSNGPNRPVGGLAQQGNAVVSGQSVNWSGTSVVAPGTPFTEEAIIGTFAVPSAHVAIGTCSDSWVYSSIWPGIDGNGSNDVLQGGAEVDALCNNGSTETFYSAWIEWYPLPEVRVNSPAIQPGDLLFVEVWNTSPTTGYVYFADESTGVTATYSLTAPNGTSLKGNSVEWIVERPSIGDSLATLTNYIDVPWAYGVAWNYGSSNPTYHYMGKNPAVLTLQTITMVDNNGNAISVPTIENSDFLWLQDTGSAY